MDTTIFETHESNVRSYCRSFPVVFDYAKGSILKSVEGREYLDFFCGAGALNYGHNNDLFKQRILDYIEQDSIIHSLDMYSVAKADFIEYFVRDILAPRGLDYKLQFTGPTGTNAVEASLKLARKYTKRTNVFALNGCFHGMTLGALALTTDLQQRAGGGVPLQNVVHCPAPYQYGDEHALRAIEDLLTDDHSGVEKPAAIVIETVQAEGGIHVFSDTYLQGIRSICDRHDILMIVDDIQVGCGRTGTFFSFERAGIVPDMAILSKSISGYGLPFSLVLIKPQFDIWEPGEHSGTFRGNTLAMIAGKAALELVHSGEIDRGTQAREAIVKDFLTQRIAPMSPDFAVRGVGLIWGIDTKDGALADKIVRNCFESGLIIERAGRASQVVKLMPSLVIPEEQLLQGLAIIEAAVKDALGVA
ncbi:MAG: diaminobutyrate--2-oxoglutarate transaminase [Coriobacteriales bacterium]|nr:diaminobutyrate--2-oxoglutarate transaminase [Coriobacteriales bacterium]